MDLDKYIGDNIDDILDNPNDYVFDGIINKKPFLVNNKKVSFELDQKIKSGDKIKKNYNIEYNNTEHNNKYDNSDYYDKIYGDIYDDDNYDDFGYVYKKNDSTDSDDEITDEIIDEITDEYIETEPNEDDYTEDIIGELYQNMYENKTNKIDIVEVFKNISQSELDKLETHELSNSTIQTSLNNNQNKNHDEFDDDDGYYFINLINIFMKYYNNKFDKIENFFSGIKGDEKSTSSQMELFYDAIIEYKTVKESFRLDDTNCMKLIYLDSDINNTTQTNDTEINKDTDTDTNTDTNTDTDKILELFSKCENQIYMLDLGFKRYVSPSLLICLNYIYENKIDSYWDIYNLRNV